MLSKIKFKNFYSFGGEFEISFKVGKKPSKSYFDIPVGLNEERLNKVIASIGPNGAGKTQMLRPLAFLSWFISSSIFESNTDKDIPFKPHELCKSKTTSFEVDFFLENEEYRYKLEATSKEVIHESLYKKTSRFYSYIFVRNKVNDGYEFKQKGFGFTKNLAVKVRKNASLLASAHMHDVEHASLFVNYFSKFEYNINVSGREHYHEGVLVESANYLQANEEIKSKVNNIICDLDLGIDCVEYKEVEGTDEKGNKESFIIPIGVHKSQRGEFKLPFFEESSGTKSAFVMLRKVLPVLEHGGVAIIDEIDNDLHPHMLSAILELFKFEHTNPLSAQIIFTCHTPEVLNQLKKHQLYLVEKEDLFSELWRLDEIVGLRADDNIYAKYQSGSLGAVPNI
ncbi:MAG: ATP-binding protein [Gammaproteobacteria bacterium]